MIEDLTESFTKEFQKYNMKGICVLSSWLFNEYVPHSKIIKGFSIRKNKYYCLQVWIENENKIYDIGNMYNMRTLPMMHLVGSPQNAIEEPIHLKNKADKHKEFSLQLKNFNPMTCYRTLLNMLKNVLKVLVEKFWKRKDF